MYGIPEPLEQLTEMDIARSKSIEQFTLFNQLCEQTPNTREQQQLFTEITENITQGTTGLYFIQGMGGSGKSTLCKKIMAWTRSQNKLALGCASTGLAAAIYDDFNTAHSLFKFPVIDECDRDEDSVLDCNFNKHPRRLELLKEVNLIVWDEFPSNHRELFEAVYKALNCFENKVVVCFGDFRQIAPVVPNGTRMQIVQASIISSFLCNKFQVRHLTQNLLLIGLSDTTRDTLLTDGEREFLKNQKAYADMITKIGEGRWKGSNYIAENKAQGTQTILLPNVTCITGQRAAIAFIYPNNFNTYNFAKRGILAGTNQEVDQYLDFPRDPYKGGRKLHLERPAVYR